MKNTDQSEFTARDKSYGLETIYINLDRSIAGRRLMGCQIGEILMILRFVRVCVPETYHRSDDVRKGRVPNKEEVEG